MSRIRSCNTRPEVLVRQSLHKAGFRYRLHRKDLPGKPNIVLSKYRLAIFVHGCFWHQHRGCVDCSNPKSNAGIRVSEVLSLSSRSVSEAWSTRIKSKVANAQRLRFRRTAESPAFRARRSFARGRRNKSDSRSRLNDGKVSQEFVHQRADASSRKGLTIRVEYRQRFRQLLLEKRMRSLKMRILRPE